VTRDYKAEIIILKSWPVKETHRGMKALSPQLGLISLIQFGGQSSRKGKRKGAEPFCYGVSQLYKDPKYDGWQLKDFELIHSFPGNREDLRRFYIQSLWAETMLLSQGGGGDGDPSFRLLLDSMSELEKADTTAFQDSLLIYYILKFLALLGMPDFYRYCGRCGNPLQRGEPLFFNNQGQYCCPRCAVQNMTPLSPGGLAFLNQLSQVAPDQLKRLSLARDSLEKLKDWLLKLLEQQLERPLKTLRSASGIL